MAPARHVAADGAGKGGRGGAEAGGHGLRRLCLDHAVLVALRAGAQFPAGHALDLQLPQDRERIAPVRHARLRDAERFRGLDNTDFQLPSKIARSPSAMASGTGRRSPCRRERSTKSDASSTER